MQSIWWRTAGALFALALTATTAGAETVKCQRTIAKASSQYVQARAKALSKCEGLVVANGTGSCPDAAAATTIATATAKLSAAIGKGCGGDDKLCGGNFLNEDLPPDVGWPGVCPNFERGACDIPIANCGDIASCVACIDAAVVDQAIDLYYDDLLLPSAGDLNLCQLTIGKATAAFLTAKSKALRTCWDAKLNDKLGAATCIPPDPGNGKYQGAILKAEIKKRATICKACGGPDQLCDGIDDISPVTIGFPATCPAVTVPGGAACGGPITDLDSLVDCVDCVTEFKVDCADRAQVPQFASYPSECNVCTLPPASGPCPTSLQLTVDGDRSDYDNGWTGLAHDATYPNDARLTLGVSGCAGISHPTCGACNLTGPLANAGGVAFDNRRCQDQSWVACTTDVDCTNAGATGPCTSFFGPPMSQSVGGVGVCLVNEILGPIGGTVNVDDGSMAATTTLRTKTHVVGSVFQPCSACGTVCLGGVSTGFLCATDADCPGSTCSAGSVCGDGPRQFQACAPQGGGTFGTTSLDCPPHPLTIASDYTVTLNLTTGTQSRTLTAVSPLCRQTGYTTLPCFCDTCNNVNAESCASNADCPISGGNPGVCGGRRCVGGGNAGTPCVAASECPSGICSRPGDPPQPNLCSDNTATPGFDGCQDVGENEGTCVFGPVDKVCSLQPFVGCVTADDCNPPPSGFCTNCLPNQTCVSRDRACFTDNGVLGASVTVTGSPDVPCGAISKSSVGALFCAPAAQASAVNAAEGLPGLGRLRLPVTVDFLP